MLSAQELNSLWSEKPVNKPIKQVTHCNLLAFTRMILFLTLKKISMFNLENEIVFGLL